MWHVATRVHLQVFQAAVDGGKYFFLSFMLQVWQTLPKQPFLMGRMVPFVTNKSFPLKTKKNAERNCNVTMYPESSPSPVAAVWASIFLLAF